MKHPPKLSQSLAICHDVRARVSFDSPVQSFRMVPSSKWERRTWQFVKANIHSGSANAVKWRHKIRRIEWMGAFTCKFCGHPSVQLNSVLSIPIAQFPTKFLFALVLSITFGRLNLITNIQHHQWKLVTFMDTWLQQLTPPIYLFNLTLSRIFNLLTIKQLELGVVGASVSKIKSKKN